MPAPRQLLVLALLVAACGDEPEPFALPEICGVEGPVRVLELRPEQALVLQPNQIGERVFYHVGEPLPGGASTPLTPFDARARWTTGPCGESPTRLPDDLSDPFELERWPGVALACDAASRSIVSLAPSGPLAPHVVFPDLDCTAPLSPLGPIDYADLGADSRVLALYPWPDDPRTGTSEPQLVFDAPLRIANNQAMFKVVGEQVFALTTLDELVRIELPDGEVTVEQTDVGDFDVSSDGRYLLTWPAPNDPDGPAGSMSLYDRETATGVSLGAGRGSFVRALVGPARTWLIFTPYLASQTERVHSLPDLAFVDVPWRNVLDGTQGLPTGGGPLADGRWILQSVENGHLRYLDLTSGEVTPMFARSAQIVAHDQAGAVVLQVPLCCTVAQADDEGPLWSVPYDGAPPQLLRERATLFTYRPNDRQLLTLVDIDERRGGSLVLLDRDGAPERTLDRHVFSNYFSLSIDPELVRYSVQDGARSGVWQVKLPP
jgi:hypothetical protein